MSQPHDWKLSDFEPQSSIISNDEPKKEIQPAILAEESKPARQEKELASRPVYPKPSNLYFEDSPYIPNLSFSGSYRNRSVQPGKNFSSPVGNQIGSFKSDLRPIQHFTPKVHQTSPDIPLFRSPAWSQPGSGEINGHNHRSLVEAFSIQKQSPSLLYSRNPGTRSEKPLVLSTIRNPPDQHFYS